ncbi:MAG TPA: ComEC/Rec2 family competence protein, partial [Syntrophales bacterium]|nr:ComEC/Rec2 family competence protein [Syntrophales bacterium]
WKNGAETRMARLGRRIVADLSLFVAVSAACTLGTLPFIVYYFNRISNITLAANLVLVPILGFVVLPFAMLLIVVAPLFPVLSALLIDITTVLTRLCLDINDWFAALPGSSSIVTTPTIPELAAYYVILISAALLMGLPGRTTWDVHVFWTRRKLSVAMALAVLFLVGDMAWLHQKLQNRETLRVTFLNVGHASATLVEFPGGHRMLVDGGGSYDDRFDVGRYVVAPFLWHERIGKIDTVALTHPHPDHVNGLPYILDNFDVKEVWSNGDEAIVHWGAAFADKIRQKGIAHRLLTSKSAPIDIGGVRISILNPGKGPPADTELDDREINERALVMQLRWHEAVFLLPGDIGEPTERVLTDRYRTLASGVLLAPHHGSAYSSSQPFLRAVRPETIVISTGRPVREDALERFRKTGAALYRTDVHGAIRITTDGRRYEVVPLKSP